MTLENLFKTLAYVVPVVFGAVAVVWKWISSNKELIKLRAENKAKDEMIQVLKQALDKLTK